MNESNPTAKLELDPIQRRALRAAAHHLNPVVSISQKGLQPSVMTEIDRNLKAHELIKVRTYGFEREDREALLEEICTALNCAAVQHIGNLLVLWRERPTQEPTNDVAPKASTRATEKQTPRTPPPKKSTPRTALRRSSSIPRPR